MLEDKEQGAPVESGKRPTPTEGSIQTSDDASVVDWDDANDPRNPMNWPSSRKWTTIVLVSFNTFNSAMASTLFAPGVPQVLDEFRTNNSALASLVVSVYIIGFAVGPLALAPLSELYGRLPITHAANVLFMISSIICAVSVNMPMLIVFRLIMGIAGCIPMTLGGAFIADLMSVAERGSAMTWWTVGPLMGPVIGPVAGGYMAMEIGWRWAFWLEAIICGVTGVLTLIFLKETYAPVLLKQKATRLQKETGQELRSKYDGKIQSAAKTIKTAIARPTKLLLTSPIVALMSLYLAVIYSYLYILFTTFPNVFSDLYGFNEGETGLAYLGLGVGFSIGQLSLGPFLDWYYKRQQALRGTMKPEDRLPPLVMGVCLVPVGLFWYGWCAEYRTHWILPIIGTGFCALGMFYAFVAIQIYLIDAFTLFAASVIAANTVARSVFGATIPLAAPALYNRLGFGWGNTLLGFIGVVFVPFSLLLVCFGERIRTAERFTPVL